MEFLKFDHDSNNLPGVSYIKDLILEHDINYLHGVTYIKNL